MTFQLLIEITDELGGKKTSQLSAATAVMRFLGPQQSQLLPQKQPELQ